MKPDLDIILADGQQGDASIRLKAEAPIGIQAAESESKRPTFEMVAYSGGTMQPMGFGMPVVVDLDGIRNLEASRPIFLGHSDDVDDILGQTTNVSAENNQLTARGEIIADGERAKRVTALAKSGFKWQASIGARILRRETVEAGASATINGRSFDGPLIVSRETDLKEISIVAIGADGETSTTIAAKQPSKQETDDMTFDQWLKAKGFDPEQITAEQRKLLEATFAAEKAAEGKGDDKSGQADKAEPKADVKAKDDSTDVKADEPADQIGEYRRLQAAEERRIKAIRDIEGAGEHGDIVAKAIEEDWTAEKAELAIVRASLPAHSTPYANVGRGQNEVSESQAIEAALCMTAGMDEADVAKNLDERTMNAAVSSDYRGFSLHGLIFACLAAIGDYPRHGSVDDSAIRAAFHADRDIQAATTSGFTTVSLSGILGNVANKALLSAFNAVSGIANAVSGIRSVNDFKQHTHYRLSADGAMTQVGPNGELKHIGLQEGNWTNQAQTRGGIVTLTRTDMINDDLGAFLAIPRLLGRQAAVALEKAIATKFIDNAGAFFTSGNGNYTDGAATALSIDALTTVEQLFRDQTDENGDPVMVEPSILLVPTSLSVTASQLMNSLQLNETTTANKGKPSNNPHAGKFTPMTSPYLNSQSITGSSATAWWLVANPADVPAVVVSYLRGRRTPVIERGEVDFSTLGMAWRGYFDFGVDFGDEQGAAKSKGAA